MEVNPWVLQNEGILDQPHNYQLHKDTPPSPYHGVCFSWYASFSVLKTQFIFVATGREFSFTKRPFGKQL